jgi:regulatory protein
MAGRPGRRQRETYAERLARRAAVDDPEIVLNVAARFLEARSRSVDEVRRQLRGYPPALVEAAIERLEPLGMLDDAAFARAWVESRDRARPRGEQALRRELADKGVDRGIVDEVLGERAGDGHSAADLDAATRLLARRGAALARLADPRRRRQRAYALLARNGFDPDVCRDAIARFEVTPGNGPADDPGEWR